MKGIELSKEYYKQFGEKMIYDNFSELIDDIAVGVVGEGSECLFFDDDISTDHDYFPSFTIFVSDNIDDKIVFNLQKAYTYLPNEFAGFKKQIASPVGGNRHGVKKLSDFLYQKTGTKDGNLSTYDYFNISEQQLIEVTNGEIWLDKSNMFNSIREKLSLYPLDIKLKKLAGEILTMAQAGQYNFKRCIAHKEYSASRLALYTYVEALIHTTFLLNDVYMPYYKWKFKSLNNLFFPNAFFNNEDYMIGFVEEMGLDADFKFTKKYRYENKFEEVLSILLSVDDNEIINNKGHNIIKIIEAISKLYIERLKTENLTCSDDDYLEAHAYEVNNRIRDIDIRNMNILSALK